MTRFVVTAEAEADTHEILSYLEREAGPTIAAEYGSRLLSALERLIDLPETGARGQVLDRARVLESFRRIF
jgi:plasmid stabilization system protein ParE